MQIHRKHRIIRFLHGLCFFVVLFVMGYYILRFEPAIYAGGSPVPHGAQMIPFNQHGYVVYITPIQALLRDLYGYVMIVLFAGWFVLGIILQVVYKVEIFRTDMPWPWSKIWPWSEMANSEKHPSQNVELKK